MTGQPTSRDTDLDLTQIDGLPTTNASQAYTHQKSDINIKVSHKVLGSLEAAFTGESPAQTAFALGFSVLPAAGIALLFEHLGLPLTANIVAAAVVYGIGVAGVFLRHKKA